MQGHSEYPTLRALGYGLAALTERVQELEAALEGAARHLAITPHPVETLGELHREIGMLREQSRRAKQDALDAQIGH